GSLGGVLTLGLNTKPSGTLLGGIPLEIWNLARAAGGAGEDYMATTKTAGVQILFETFVSNPVVEDGAVTGVVIEGKSGRQFVGAKVLIDCSADADMA